MKEYKKVYQILCYVESYRIGKTMYDGIIPGEICNSMCLAKKKREEYLVNGFPGRENTTIKRVYIHKCFISKRHSYLYKGKVYGL